MKVKWKVTRLFCALLSRTMPNTNGRSLLLTYIYNYLTICTKKFSFSNYGGIGSCLMTGIHNSNVYSFDLPMVILKVIFILSYLFLYSISSYYFINSLLLLKHWLRKVISRASTKSIIYLIHFFLISWSKAKINFYKLRRVNWIIFERTVAVWGHSRSLLQWYWHDIHLSKYNFLIAEAFLLYRFLPYFPAWRSEILSKRCWDNLSLRKSWNLYMIASEWEDSYRKT